ncbi:MAG: ribokinase [Alphaproteobacteria bacterium]|nr:ribokinase [Alphaproteobacteria bacterium]
MLASLLAQIGLPLLVKTVGGALGRLDHPAAKSAAEALAGVGTAIERGAISPEALSEANRHVERMAAIDAEREAKILSEINQTIRAEALSEDHYVRRMRPTFGYILALTWFAQMLAVAYVIAFEPTQAGDVVGALGQLSAIWTVGLSVLGIYVYKRSQEKTGLGHTTPGLLKGLVQRLDPGAPR